MENSRQRHPDFKEKKGGKCRAKEFKQKEYITI